MIELVFLVFVYYYMALYAYAALKTVGIVILFMTTISFIFFGGIYYFVLEELYFGEALLCVGIITTIANVFLYLNHGTEENI